MCYLNILLSFEVDYLHNLPPADHENLYQHDGAPPHINHPVNNQLQNFFHDQRISNQIYGHLQTY